MPEDRNLATGKVDDSTVLPLPESDACVQLHLLDGGSFVASESRMHANVEERTFRAYNWAFLVTHTDAIDGTQRHALWDYGMSSNREYYTPWVQMFMLDVTNATGPKVSILDQLRRHDVDPSDVESVIFSHAHWDHCRPIKEDFPQATAYFGPGTAAACSPGHLVEKDAQWDGRFFDLKNATENWQELAGPWVRFGPFERAMDFFGDQSFWVIQAPGHMTGNLCAAARIDREEWVILGSDCCHSRELFDGVHDVAFWTNPDGSEASLQEDLPAARDTIARIRLIEQKFGAHVAFAHDVSWMKKGTDRVLFSLLDSEMERLVREEILTQNSN